MISNAQATTVNLNGEVAENIRKVMRQTGWTVEQSLAHILTRVFDRHNTFGVLVKVNDMAIEGNEVGVQVVKNTITAHLMNVGDPVMVKILSDSHTLVEAYGVVNGFAPQGIGVTLTDRSVAAARSLGIHVNKDDLWDVEDVKAL